MSDYDNEIFDHARIEITSTQSIKISNPKNNQECCDNCKHWTTTSKGVYICSDGYFFVCNKCLEMLNENTEEGKS